MLLVFFYRKYDTDSFRGFPVVTQFVTHVWDSLEIKLSKAPKTINIFKKFQGNQIKISYINMWFLYQPIVVAPERLIEFYKISIGADFLTEN